MFFDEITQIPKIAARTSCIVFVVPSGTKVNLKNAITITPLDDKKTASISVDQIRELIALTNNREVTERYFIITPAEAMNESAQNAFLKTFEEPKPHCHFVLLTSQPSALLPTILSRAQIFFLRQTNLIESAPKVKAKTLEYAKKLIAATPKDLPNLATEFTKSKTKPREQALEIVATAIELLYKTYFKTNNTKFLSKIPKLIQLYDALNQNGHIKLHLVADLC